MTLVWPYALTLVALLTWKAAEGMSCSCASACTGLVAMKLAETGGGGGVKAEMGGGGASWQLGLEQACPQG